MKNYAVTLNVCLQFGLVLLEIAVSYWLSSNKKILLERILEIRKIILIRKFYLPTGQN